MPKRSRVKMDHARLGGTLRPAFFCSVARRLSATPSTTSFATKRAAEAAGADFVKSSTGFHPAGGATVEAIGSCPGRLADGSGSKRQEASMTPNRRSPWSTPVPPELGLSASAAILGEFGQTLSPGNQDAGRRAHRRQTGWSRHRQRGPTRADRRLQRQGGPRLPDGGVLDGGLPARVRPRRDRGPDRRHGRLRRPGSTSQSSVGNGGQHSPVGGRQHHPGCRPFSRRPGHADRQAVRAGAWASPGGPSTSSRPSPACAPAHREGTAGPGRAHRPGGVRPKLPTSSPPTRPSMPYATSPPRLATRRSSPPAS